ERLEDGRFNILLHGLARARIEELIPPAPYRRARVRVLPEPAGAVSPRLERVRLGLLAVYSSVLNSGSSGPIQIEPNLSLGTLCDRLAAILEVEVAQKQAVLEELEPAARAARTIELIRQSPLAGQPVESGLRKIAKRAWPPDSSSN
ncbi:MAG TPA: LON peptidase substrate-binding domain-containing protein, partial [Planctomycetota bacterium]|nr:LON peptidase substrate-binding domain-containing protein [Planctomycetota bacterium]